MSSLRPSLPSFPTPSSPVPSPGNLCETELLALVKCAVSYEEILYCHNHTDAFRTCKLERGHIIRH